MKARGYGLWAAGLSAVLVTGALIGCLKWRSPQTVVREPAAPGESRLAYTPPPDPGLSVEFIRSVGPMLTTMLGPHMVKISDDIHVAVGYGFGSVVMVITEEGLVIVDSGASIESAQTMLAEFRKITDKPIRYLIYTHSHQDHTLGSTVFHSEGVEVVAGKQFPEFRHYQEVMLKEHINRARAIQFGFIEPEYAFPLPLSGGPVELMKKAWPEVVPPTITFEGQYEFTLGGKKFVLFESPGETPDTISIWLPEKKVLICGDNYYHSFPNLSTPLLESRPVKEWAESIQKYIELAPEVLIPMHTNPLKGADLIREHLTNYRDAINFVHDETVRAINQGKTVEQAVAEIKLPEHLAKLPYLQEYYGQVSWSVRGIYRGYTGWYDGMGTGLNPLPPSYKARELVALAGGADKILARAIELQKNGEHQLTAELCDVVIEANPDDRMAHRIKAQSMFNLAYASLNLNSFLCYRSAYSMHMKAAGEKPVSLEFRPAPVGR